MAEEVPLDPNLVALFSDAHVTADKTCAHSSAGLSCCIKDVLACNPRPSQVLIYGDLAVNHGVTNDYRVLKRLTEPLEKAGIRWSACMGNHDRLAAVSLGFS
jgi:metallophosphoesterase superfamily enzyme